MPYRGAASSILCTSPYAGSSDVATSWPVPALNSTPAEQGEIFGLLAWHIILMVAQPGRKRDPDASAGEPPVFGKIVEDHFSRVFV